MSKSTKRILCILFFVYFCTTVLFFVIDSYNFNILKSSITLFIIVCSIVICGKIWEVKYKISCSIASQIAIIFFYIMIFVYAALFKTYANITRPKSILILTTVSTVFCVTFSAIAINKKNIGESFLSRIKKNKYLIILILITVLIRLPQMGTVIRWDSQVYYAHLQSACENFDFSFSSLFNGFRLAGHPTIGYASFLAILEFLMPGNIYNISISNLFLSIILVISVYKILAYFLKKENICTMFLSVCVSSLPIFLGTYTYYHMDFGVCIFFFMLLFCHIYKYYLWELFTGLLLIQSKEVGVIVLGGYVLFFLVAKFISVKGAFIDRFRVIIKCKETWPLIGITLAGCIYMFLSITGILNGWQMTDSSGNAITEMNYFSFDLKYILHKLKEIFILNFQWIVVIIIASLVPVNLLTRRNKKIDNYIWGILGSIVSYLLFSMIYITYPLPRYNIVIMMETVLVMCILIGDTFKKCFVQCFFCIIISMIFIIQSYFTIDPVSIKIFKNLNANGLPLLQTSLEDGYIGDYCVYNYQYSFLDKGIAKILSDIDYKGEIPLFIKNTADDLFLGGNRQFFPIYWDRMEEKWTYTISEYTIEINEQKIWDFTVDTLPETILLIDIPYYNDVNQDEYWENILTHYTIIDEEKEIKVGCYGSMCYGIYTKK